MLIRFLDFVNCDLCSNCFTVSFFDFCRSFMRLIVYTLYIAWFLANIVCYTYKG
jgi:hypothetical protein